MEPQSSHDHVFATLISSVPRSRRFGLVASRPCLAFQVLFFATAWLIPLISEPHDMTWITWSCRGGKVGAASLGFPIVPLLSPPFCDCGRGGSLTKGQGSGRNQVLSSSEAT
ncbi:hypothetical protein DY000_02052837 [Brassica cretica]|uniref:Uncharacterized protein n=1 Tax=Brassica cretica TaxID=69181 RepID=A0ABQ7A9R9_BRACR|nr:hypothetical protein DY000_02052837 [Brassica cretica]